MKRSVPIWLAFAFCLAVSFVAVAWISFKVVELDRNDAQSRRRGQLEENVRLALWRMDSALAPLIAQENSRPYYTYTTSVFFPSASGKAASVQPVASPLLVHSSDILPLHFHINHEGRLTSPQVPANSELRTLIEFKFVTPNQLDASANRLKQLKQFIKPESLLAALPEVKTPPETDLPPLAQNGGQPQWYNGSIANNTAQAANPNDASQYLAQNKAYPAQQSERGELEYQRRSQIIQAQQGNWDNQGLNNRYFDRNFTTLPPATVFEGVVKPVWVGQNLLLARRVQIDHYDHVQGCWVNWPATRAWLLNLVADLVPGADLVPASPKGVRQSRLLAALPVRLVTDNVPLAEVPPSPVKLSLVIAWGSMLLATLAAAVLLRGVISLSNRRASFVSAVTHELRTPLTTLRMYTEMLSDGMVAGPEQQRSYLLTLKGEANRLGHLVENVLGYSRLERRRSAGRVESMRLGDLLAGITPRLAERAQQGGMSLEPGIPDDAASQHVRVDPVAVEQILFNLVDNACKYAACADDRRIALAAAADGRHVTLRVCDRGPGIPPPQARRLFRPFSKTVYEAAATKKPGLGLGLSLSRRLARDMSGDLSHEPTRQGACFALWLPLGQGD